MNKLSAIITRVLIATTILLLLIGGTLLLLPSVRLRILEATYRGGGGGACGTIALYDRQGHLHQIPLRADQLPEVPLYFGEAPLYDMGTRVLDPVYPDSCEYPKSFPPEEVAKGEAVYPLVLESSLISQIKVGESKHLKVTGLVQDNFSGLDLSQQYFVRLNPGERIELVFRLDAPQFKYDLEPRTVELVIGRPFDVEWAIAPQDTAAGQQSIGVIVESHSANSTDKTLYLGNYKIAIEVRPISGAEPRLLAKLSLWGSAFMGCLTVVKTIYDMLPKASSQKETKNKSRTKKRTID
jgi:hypothetical protein